MSAQVFISYRRKDTPHEAFLISKDIRHALGEDSVFMDASSISPGDQWPQEIQSALKTAETVIVIIGPKWLHIDNSGSGQRCIDDPDNWVRKEVTFALKENKRVIPVLVNGAKMPLADDLPEEIESLQKRQGFELRNDYWEHDIKLLVDSM